MNNIKCIIEIAGHVYDGMSKGARYNAQLFNQPVWVGWAVGIIFAPIGITWVLVCAIARRWDIIEEQSEEVDLELEGE